MGNILDTLVHLEVAFERCHNFYKYYSGVLPFPLPHLKSLKIHSFGFDAAECDKLFVDNVFQSPKLEYLYLEVDAKYSDNDVLERLSQINNLHVRISSSADSTVSQPIALGIGLISINLGMDDEKLLDPDSRFKKVWIFGDRIVKASLWMEVNWTPRTTLAFKHLLKMCKNLESFRLAIRPNSQTDQEEPIRAEKHLKDFFNDSARVSELWEIYLSSDDMDFRFDAQTFSLMFENCLNLESLSIQECSNFHNVHLIEFANRGGKLNRVRIDLCKSISDDGLIELF